MKEYFTVEESYEKYSIVKNDYYSARYPRKLLLGQKVELKIKEIDSNNKIWFDLDIFSDVNDHWIFANFHKKINIHESFGVIEVAYNSHIFQITTAKWMMSDDFIFPDRLKIHLKIDGSKKSPSKLSIPFLEHPHFEMAKSYDFEVVDFIKESEMVKIRDPRSDFIYYANKHFSEFKINIGEIKKYTFIGFNKKYNCHFELSEDKFLDPNSILSKEEYLQLIDNHLVNSGLRLDFISQIKNKDSFWIITATRYLKDVAINYFERFKINEAYQLNKINLKLLGFSFDKNIFRNIPVKGLKENIENNRTTANSLDDVGELMLLRSFDDLFYDDSLSLDYSCKTFVSYFKVFKFNIIDEEKFLEILERSLKFKEDKLYEKSLSVLRTSFLNYVEKNIIDLFNSHYFIDKKNKKTWVEKNNLLINIKILKFFYENVIYNFNYESDSYKNNVFINLLETISNDDKNERSKKFIETSLRNFPKTNNSIKIVDDEIITVGDFINFKDYSFINDNEKVVICHNHFHYLIDYYNTNSDFEHKLKIISNFNDKIFLVEPTYINSNLNKQDYNKLNTGDIIDVVVKTVKNGYAFGTYYHDKESNMFFDGMIRVKENPYLFKNNTLYSGKVMKCYVEKNTEHNEDESKIILFPVDNPFDLNKYGITAKGTVVDVCRENNRCPSCDSKNIKYISKGTKVLCNNEECNHTYFIGSTIHLDQFDKYIFINKFSVHTENGFDFIEKLRLGDTYNFYIESSKSDKVFLTTKERSKFKILDVYYVQPSEIIINKVPEHKKRDVIFNIFLKNIFVLINDIIDFNPDTNVKNQLISLGKSIGSIIKNPKTYFLTLLSDYNNIIDRFKNNEDIDDSIKDFKINIESNFQETFDRFPDVKKINDVVNCLFYFGKNNFNEIAKNIGTDDTLTNKLKKTILIYNLISSDEPNSHESRLFRKKIIKILDERVKKIYSSKYIEPALDTESEEIRTLKLIENGEVGEDKTIEFKETIKTPVLTMSQHNRIKSLKSIGGKENEIQLIENSININDKKIQKEVTISTFKNICAMLNSNSGQIIIGIRDDLSLVGLGSDYKLMQSYDEFQQYFDSKWNDLMCEPERYRPYVEIKKVTYNQKDFCFVQVEMPHDFLEPCFIKINKNGENIEECYIKANSTTKSLKGRELNLFQRKVNKSNKSEECYVYIMSDKENNKKIGYSINPKRRAKTLMVSDKEVKLLHAYKFPSVDMARRYEQKLHDDYKSKRIYGEWFNLNDSELNSINNFLLNQESLFPSKNKKDKDLFSHN